MITAHHAGSEYERRSPLLVLLIAAACNVVLLPNEGPFESSRMHQIQDTPMRSAHERVAGDGMGWELDVTLSGYHNTSAAT